MTVRDADTLKSYFILSKVPVPSQYNDLIDTIFSMSGGGGGGGLHDDRYVKLSLQDTITAIHTFNPTTADAPFILGTNAKNKTVIGFRADQLAKSIIAGNGLTGGGLLTSDVTLYVGQGDGITVAADTVSLTTPGTLSVSSSNNASGNHTHAITASSDPSTTSSLLKTNNSGFLNLVRLNVDTLADESGSSLTISPVGDIIFNPTSDYIVPTTNYDLNLGMLSKKYLTLHAAELWVETLVAQDTIATIGGRILVGPTTVLEADVSSSRTQLALNPGFEVSGAGGADVFDRWFENAGSGTIVKDGTIYWDGLASCRLTPSIGNNTFVYQQFDVTDREAYTFSFYARGNGTSAGRYGVYDASNSAWIIPLTSTGVTAASWTKVSQMTFVIPSGCTVISIYFYCPSSGINSVWFDGVLLYADYIVVKHDQMRSSDIAYLEADGKVEFMRILTDPGGSSPFTYYVERDLDGTGLNAWYAGDAVFNTGYTGDGFIDLYSYSGIKSGTAGPTIVGNVRTSTVYNAWIEHWAIGNLNGLYGQGNVYGVALGKYANSSSFAIIDSASGIRMRAKDGAGTETTKFQVQPDGDLFIGENVAAAGTTFLSIFVNAQTYNSESMSAGDVLIGDNSASKANLFWDKSAGTLNFRIATTANMIFNTDASIRIGAPSAPHTIIDSTGMVFNTATGNALLEIDASNEVVYVGLPQAIKLNDYGIRCLLTYGGSPNVGLIFDDTLNADDAGIFRINGSIISTGEYEGHIEMMSFAGDAASSNLLELAAAPPTGGTGLAAGIVLLGNYTGTSCYVSLRLGGILRFDIYSASTVVNEQGNDYDFRVESNTITNMLIVDAGLDAVGIGGAASSGYDLTVNGPTKLTDNAVITDKDSHPTYYSSGEQFYGFTGAIIQQNINNRRFNLTGGGGALTLLSPLTFPSPRAVWLTGTGSDYDFTRYHTPLTPNSMANSTYKTTSPGPLYICDFNGTSSYLSVDLTTYAHLNVVNWFSFGAWIYIDATGRNHAVGAMGSTTNAWYLIWYNAGGYWELGYVDTGGTTRRVQRTATLTTGWHFVGFEHGWTASGNNHTLIRYDNTTTGLDNQAWLGMRSGAGYLTLGNYASYFLDGKMASAWMAGYMPAGVGDNLAEYYNLTLGLFK